MKGPKTTLRLTESLRGSQDSETVVFMAMVYPRERIQIRINEGNEDYGERLRRKLACAPFRAVKQEPSSFFQGVCVTCSKCY